MPNRGCRRSARRRRLPPSRPRRRRVGQRRSRRHRRHVGRRSISMRRRHARSRMQPRSDLGVALHLIKLCVGCDSVKDLEDWIREKRRRTRGKKTEHVHTTRMVPKRADELVDGGSLYWVIRGEVACRQRLIAVRPYVDKGGVGQCHLVLEPKVVPVKPRPWRAFQGWRYLEVKEAPPDLERAAPGAKNMPEAM